ncbi:/ / Regulator of chromosome condensation (RCC1) repeat protein / 326052:328028 Forward [Candidatus Hepatoplasma crinochetorum]|uniref:/ / Regulator of chromosome condensation (RCC1) repeat protein / 326052:328028 Forward n=1 Tax=Candidatus Hepatoplasma crinochetorum TaxID=295596 RepID=A0A0G7ZKX6_9MOLU|nr:/ / Regulator of chromosome condensation (RCC1) repeat protein / 326052:328028 Forward [Candidatus Hepatoplasma crinochetorum]
MKFTKKLLLPITLLFIPTFFINNLNLNNFNNFKKEINSDYDFIIDQEDSTYFSGEILDTDLDGYGDSLYMWGKNNKGQIGNGTTNNADSGPIEIFPHNSDWNGNLIDLELGEEHSGVTVDTDYNGYADTLYMWGSNDYGQIGNGSSINYFFYPVKITPKNYINWKGNIIDLSLEGNFSSVIIDTDLDGYADTLYMWGENNNKQLGNGTDISLNTPTIIVPENGDWNGNLIDLELGQNDSALTIDTDLDGYADTLYMWGSNAFCQLGQNESKFIDQAYPKITEPITSDQFLGNILDVSTSIYSSGIIVDSDLDNYGDTLYMWGTNVNGVLANDNIIIPIPAIVTSISGNLINFETNNKNSGVTIDTDLDGYADTLYMWGDNEYGQAGIGNLNQSYINYPTAIFPYSDSWNGNILNYSIGKTYASVIIDQNWDGYGDRLYMWGSNEYGEAGIAPCPNFIIPNSIFESKSFQISDLEIINNQNHGFDLNITLNDYWNIFDANNIPEISLFDQYNNLYDLTYLEDDSSPIDDIYSFEINNIEIGTKYVFTKVQIDTIYFNFTPIISISDYLISNLELEETGINNAIFNLDVVLGSNLNISYFTSDQRKVKVNFSDDTYQEVLIDQNWDVELKELNSDTSYQIIGIDYFYENESYKYNLPVDITFKTLIEEY